MRAIPTLPAGVYRHYKGQLYLLLGIAQPSDPETELVVVYVPLYPADGVRMRTRPLERWSEYVDSDGAPVPLEVERKSMGSLRYITDRGFRPRFRFIGTRLDQDDVDESNARVSWD